jgi:hypothetical protein
LACGYPVDSEKFRKLSTAYPQWQKSHKRSYPQDIHRVMHIENCGEITTERKTRLTNGFLAGVSRPKFYNFELESPSTST